METAEADRIDEFPSEQTPEKQEESPAEKTGAGSASMELFAHMNGTVIPLEEVKDDAFSQKVLGEGVAIEPEEGKLYSPCDGKIEMVFDTRHAITLVSEEGCEILLHIGIDTVKDDAFSQKVLGEGVAIEPEEGKLYSLCDGKIEMVFDLEGIHNEGYQTTTPLIICNTDDYSSVRSAGSRKISAGESLVEIILQVQ